MPTPMKEQRKFLETQYNVFYPKLNAEEREALNDVYQLEFERLLSLSPMPKETPKSQMAKLVKDLQSKARDEQFLTLDAWIEDGLTPFRVMVTSQQPISPEWLTEALRRSEWNKFDLQPIVVGPQVVPTVKFETEEQTLRKVHGLIVLTQGELHPRVDRLLQMAVQLGLRTYVLDLKKARIRKPRVKCPTP